MAQLPQGAHGELGIRRLVKGGKCARNLKANRKFAPQWPQSIIRLVLSFGTSTILKTFLWQHSKDNIGEVDFLSLQVSHDNLYTCNLHKTCYMCMWKPWRSTCTFMKYSIYVSSIYWAFIVCILPFHRALAGLQPAWRGCCQWTHLRKPLLAVKHQSGVLCPNLVFLYLLQ